MGSVRSLLGVRYAADGAGHVESYFLKANDPDPRRRRALWLKTTIYASGRGVTGEPHAVAEAWAIAFDADRGHVAVKTSIPFERARFDRRALDVDVAGVVLRPHETRGRVESGGRAIEWDLSLLSDGMPIVHFPQPWMYEAKLPSTKIVSPFPDLRASGSLTVNGERWEIDRWPGLLGHNWGPRHTPLYAWGHCNLWEREGEREREATTDPAATEREPDVVFEGLTAKVRPGRFSPLATLLCLRWRGVRYDLNGALDLVTNRGEITPRRWRFEGANRHLALRGEMWGTSDDFVGLFYENPDGPPTHCLNSKLAEARLEIDVRGRAPFVVRSRSAALEIGTLDPTHGVRMYV
jgi:hypothetical protein